MTYIDDNEKILRKLFKEYISKKIGGKKYE